MNSIGSICGTFIIGVLSILWGSKQAMTFLAYPAIAFWLLIYYGNTFYHILIARFANGLTGGGFQSGVVLFVSEISDDKYVFEKFNCSTFTCETKLIQFQYERALRFSYSSSKKCWCIDCLHRWCNRQIRI